MYERWLGDVDVDDGPTDDERIVYYEDQLNQIHRQVGMFGSKGWKDVEKQLIDALEQAVTQLADSKFDLPQTQFIRGQIRAFQYLLDLAASAKMRRDLFTRELKSLRSPPEEAE